MKRLVPNAALAAIVIAAGCASSSNSLPAGKRTATAAPASAGAASVGPTNPAQSPAPKPAVIELRVIKRNGAAVAIAPVIIHGRTYPFIVDTGATATLISSSFAKQLDLKRVNHAPIPVTGATGAGHAYLATISDWKIGRAKIPTSTVTVGDLSLGEIAGLLGSDVLSTFGKVTIDYGHATASLG